MKVVKCEKGQLDLVLKTANLAFSSDRPKGFCFEKAMPYYYASENLDFSNSHFICYKEDAPIGIAGNIIDLAYSKDKTVKFSRVGTVGVISSHRNMGVMKALMGAIDKENTDNGVVFSVLAGKRNRYKNYGYEKLSNSIVYTFDKDQVKYLLPCSVSIRPYEPTDLETLFFIYQQCEPLRIRTKDNFINYLTTNSTLFSLQSNGIVVGYFAVRENSIIEFNVIDANLVEGCIYSILSSDKVSFYKDEFCNQTISLCVNVLKKELIQKLDKIADKKTTFDEFCYKVYDIKAFIEFLFSINDKCIKKASESYLIDGKPYTFSVKNNVLKISDKKKRINKTFPSVQDFLRYALNESSGSKIFPLSISINPADDF